LDEMIADEYIELVQQQAMADQQMMVEVWTK
jgi:hypothetical protein